jgi:hypothetical protein
MDVVVFSLDFGNDESVTVVFHNCRSLQKHFIDITKDIFHVHADILALCETRVFLPGSKYDIPSIQLFKKTWLAVYSK